MKILPVSSTLVILACRSLRAEPGIPRLHERGLLLLRRKPKQRSHFS